MHKPKRSEFKDRKDYAQALQVYELIVLACEHGAPLYIVKDLLTQYDGGFASWDFLFKEAK